MKKNEQMKGEEKITRTWDDCARKRWKRRKETKGECERKKKEAEQKVMGEKGRIKLKSIRAIWVFPILNEGAVTKQRCKTFSFSISIIFKMTICKTDFWIICFGKLFNKLLIISGI